MITDVDGDEAIIQCEITAGKFYCSAIDITNELKILIDLICSLI